MTNFAFHDKLHFYDNYDPLRDFRTHFPGGAPSVCELNMAAREQENIRDAFARQANDILRSYRSSNISNIERAITSQSNSDTALEEQENECTNGRLPREPQPPLTFSAQSRQRSRLSPNTDELVQVQVQIQPSQQFVMHYVELFQPSLTLEAENVATAALVPRREKSLQRSRKSKTP